MNDLKPERGTAKRDSRLPDTGVWLGGALVWGLLMALNVALSVNVFGHDAGHHLYDLLLLYFIGGFLGWFLAIPLISRVSGNAPAQTRLAAWLLLLGLGTIGATAGLFALQYRIFYSHWHEPFPSRVWFFQQIFTTASALYQFAVLGLRHYLPAGIIGLILISLVMVSRRR